MTNHFYFQSFLVDYFVFIKVKEWLQKITRSETTFERIYNKTKTTDWLPTPSLDSLSRRKNIKSPNLSTDPLTSFSESIKSSKTSIPIQENGFLFFNDGAEQRMVSKLPDEIPNQFIIGIQEEEEAR